MQLLSNLRSLGTTLVLLAATPALAQTANDLMAKGDAHDARLEAQTALNYYLPALNWEEGGTIDPDVFYIQDSAGGSVAGSAYDADYKTGLIEFSDVGSVFKPYAKKVKEHREVFDPFIAVCGYELVSSFWHRYDASG